MDSVNLKILQLMAVGLTQKDISEYLKKKGITPNSVSIIEKRLRSIKKEYNAKTLFHLALILKKKNIIK